LFEHKPAPASEAGLTLAGYRLWMNGDPYRLAWFSLILALTWVGVVMSEADACSARRLRQCRAALLKSVFLLPMCSEVIVILSVITPRTYVILFAPLA
jgi:hypothetical protein